MESGFLLLVGGVQFLRCLHHLWPGEIFTNFHFLLVQMHICLFAHLFLALRHLEMFATSIPNDFLLHIIYIWRFFMVFWNGGTPSHPPFIDGVSPIIDGFSMIFHDFSIHFHSIFIGFSLIIDGVSSYWGTPQGSGSWPKPGITLAEARERVESSRTRPAGWFEDAEVSISWRVHTYIHILTYIYI